VLSSTPEATPIALTNDEHAELEGLATLDEDGAPAVPARADRAYLWRRTVPEKDSASTMLL
jgi:hypothetical protein